MLINNWNQLKTRWWISWPLDLALILAMVWGISAWQTKDLLPTSDNTKAPTFELPALDGNIYRLTGTQAKTTLVYFFAPWCSICHLSISNLEKLRQLRTSAELSIILIALNWRDLAEVKQFVAEHQLTVPVLLGTPNLAAAYQITGFPTYYVLDAEGKVIQRAMGYSTEWGLRWRTWF